MDRKVILITGATDGIGKQTALELARTESVILLHGRSESKVKSTVERISNESNNKNVYGFVADFAKLDEVRSLAQQLKKDQPGINVLINNAGVYMKKRQLTIDGYETTFQVNHLAPFLLTNLLLDSLIKNAPSRIINVSSTTHHGSSIDFDNLQGEKHYDAYNAYSVSKLANVLFTFELAERLKDKNITVNALHPDAVGTKLLHEGFGGGGISVKQGAETPVYLAFSDEIKNITGEYFTNKKIAKASSLADDKKLREVFWKVSKQMVKLD